MRRRSRIVPEGADVNAAEEGDPAPTDNDIVLNRADASTSASTSSTVGASLAEASRVILIVTRACRRILSYASCTLSFCAALLGQTEADEKNELANRFPEVGPGIGPDEEPDRLVGEWVGLFDLLEELSSSFFAPLNGDTQPERFTDAKPATVRMTRISPPLAVRGTV